MRNKRCVAFAFAFIFAFIAFSVPRSAFAYDYSAYSIFQNEWYEDGNIDPTQGWIIYANNKYDAALYVCGDNVSNLTDEQLNYLSDENYGGAFYSLAQRFGNSYDHGWIPDYVRPMLSLVPIDKLQVGWATTYEISQAKARLQEVMNGDYGSGGGSGGGTTEEPNTDIPTTITFTDSDYAGNTSKKFYIDYANNGQQSPLVLNGTIDISSIRQDMANRVSSYPYVVYNIHCNNNPSERYPQKLTLDILMSSEASVINNGVDIRVNGNYTSRQVDLTPTITVSGAYQFVAGNNNRWYPSRSPVSNASYTTLTSINYVIGNYFASEPVAPDGNWPSEPVAPSPPELPTPTSPTVPVEPEPTIPEPTVPSDPIYIPVQAPDSTDYTDWLRAILSALNNIDSEIVTLSTNLGDFFAAVNQYLVRLIQDIATHCDHLQTAMNTEFTSLKSYLQELFTWLGEQMQFNFEGYDDTSIISWLRKIYSRLGGGTYKPNPDAEPKNFLDWLLEQWNRFFTSLLEKLPDAMGDLVNDFQQLTRFFPFSIPWDLAALLGLFAHAPVTPVFDIPLPFGAGSGQSASIHVDCTPWDGVAAMIRPCFLAMFCLQLALLTRDLLKGLNVTGGDE